jgi:hypothetical protein
VLNAPSWRSKSLLTQDETLQTFSCPFDTGALINEMKHIFSLEASHVHESMEGKGSQRAAQPGGWRSFAASRAERWRG